MKSLWRREKRIITPPNKHAWWGKLAQFPTVLKVEERRWRIYFTARNHQNKGYIISIDVDPLNSMKIIDEQYTPIVSLGEIGTFDYDGTGCNCVCTINDKLHMYYTGLQLGTESLFSASIGVLTSNDKGKTFQRTYDGPVLNSGVFDPFSVVTTQVKKIDQKYHMWYASTRFWDLDVKPHPEYCYYIKHATSTNGIHWITENKPCINFKSEEERGITRPWVVSSENGYEMWFCYRGAYSLSQPHLRAYRIGYATSNDKENWERTDDSHQFVNPPVVGDWDFDMQCYPCIVKSNDKTYMFYCGNGYGATGFGYAVRL